MAEINYDDLRAKLNAGNSWPQIYMFKFIVPSDNQKIALVESLFGDDADIKLLPSSKGKYTSLTARVVMLDADTIIDVYKRAAEIEGIISL
jgi:putative lipoic acid-binding regulatory protein